MDPRRSRWRRAAESGADDGAIRKGNVDFFVARLEMQHASLGLLTNQLKDVGDAEVFERSLEGHYLVLAKRSRTATR
jgi:hypothetical protein